MSSSQPLVRSADVMEPERLKPLWRIYAGMPFQQRGARWHPQTFVPPTVWRQRAIRARTEDVAAYRQLCGASRPDCLPPVYPHVLATPLQLNLLASDDFPVNLAGLIHVEQAIEWHRPLHGDTGFDIECMMSGPREAEHGWLFRLDTDVHCDGERIWREEISFLKPDPARRVRPKRRSREDDANHFVPLLHMQFPEGTGRRYARVSGDWNPIHLWQFTAKRFGFRQPIAHGMYSLARCLAILEARGVELTGKRMEAKFRAPVMLPAFTNFCLSDRWPDEVFALADARKGRILVEGRLKAMGEVRGERTVIEAM